MPCHTTHRIEMERRDGRQSPRPPICQSIRHFDIHLVRDSKWRKLGRNCRRKMIVFQEATPMSNRMGLASSNVRKQSRAGSSADVDLVIRRCRRWVRGIESKQLALLFESSSPVLVRPLYNMRDDVYDLDVGRRRRETEIEVGQGCNGGHARRD